MKHPGVEDGRPFLPQHSVEPPQRIQPPLGCHPQINNGNAKLANLLGDNFVAIVEAEDAGGVTLAVAVRQQPVKGGLRPAPVEFGDEVDDGRRLLMGRY